MNPASRTAAVPVSGPAPDPARILVRGVNWLGDAVMTTPALRRLRERFPAAHLTLLTRDKLADLWHQHPCIDAVLAIQAGEGLGCVVRALRAERFELALLLPNSFRSALEVWLARIPRRVGGGGQGRGWLLTQAVPPRAGAVAMRKRSAAEVRRLLRGAAPVPRPSPGPGPGLGPGSDVAHHVHQYLHLVAALGANPEPLPPHLRVERVEVERVVARFGLPPPGPVTGNDRPALLGLNAGAEYGPAKRWPLERFVAAAVAVVRRTGAAVCVFGGPAERDAALALSEQLRQALGSEGGPVRCLAGETSLRELCAALRLCRVLLTNDSGPMHVAAALGTPVVALFGSTSPRLTAPGLPGDGRHALLSVPPACAPCFRRDCPVDARCLRAVSVDAAVEALLRRWGMED